MTNKIDPSKITKEQLDRIPEDKWEFEMMDDMGRIVSRFWIDRETDTFVRRTTNPDESELLKINAAQFEDSKTMRFGDGRVIANIPMNVYYSTLAGRAKEGDNDFLKWWLNHEDNRPYRSFRGKV